MAPRKVEVAAEYPGLGQIIADKITTELTRFMSKHAFLQGDRSLMEIKAMFLEKSRRPEVGTEELRKYYEEELLPRLAAIKIEMVDGRIIVIEEQRRIAQMPEMKTFDELRDTVIKELEEEVPEEAEDSAVDSIIAGDMRVSDLFLPFQRKIIKRVLQILDEAIDVEDEVIESATQRGVSITLEKCGEGFFETLYLDDQKIRSEVSEGTLNKEIADAILSTRSDIENFVGESGLDQKRRLKAMRMAHLVPIDLNDESLIEPPDPSRAAFDKELRKRLTKAGELVRKQIGGKGLTEREEKILRTLYGVTADSKEEVGATQGLPKTTIDRLAQMEIEAGIRMGRIKLPPKPPKKPRGSDHLKLVKRPPKGGDNDSNS